ncbi:DUF3135 domain-containing protein [Vibrio hannami]|uniref:DUF3135 domain-containing protein n=1 Tax=Vibrio hannami TaxID=2717094 RepID=UPI00240F474B|nr:DUF3135 domain-containing protein [Vibrio hannami]MDG3084643.1 DUF3135 domain-containing protein [Vibrio hannami]
MEYAEIEQTLPPFDELVELAENNPKAFELFKQEMCEQAITFASEEMRPRLRAQQSHIDRVIKRCKNPHHTNVVLMQELSSQMGKFKEVLDGDIDLNETAEVIPFNHPNHCAR